MQSLLDDRYFRTTVLVTEYYDPKVPLPPHDVVFNSIGDADLCRDGLDAARELLARTSRPVINHPAQVLKTGRVANAERLRGLPNVVVPRMMPLPRRALATARRRRSGRRPGIFVSAFGARAGLSHRPSFRPRGNASRACRRRGAFPRR